MKVIYEIFKSTLIAILVMATGSYGMMIPSKSTENQSIAEREELLCHIASLLYSVEIQHKLIALGLTREEAFERIKNLDDTDLAVVASNLEALQFAGRRGYSHAEYSGYIIWPDPCLSIAGIILVASGLVLLELSYY